MSVLRHRFLLAAAVSAMCGLPMLGPLPLAAAAKRPPVDRASLVLDRFTFGQRFGDVEQIRSMGIDAWFERQLAPSGIDDSTLEERLKMYPALRFSPKERATRYPSPSTIRQLAKSGKLPDDPELRAIVQDQVEFYQLRQDLKVQNLEDQKMAAGQVTEAKQTSTVQTEVSGTQGMQGSSPQSLNSVQTPPVSPPVRISLQDSVAPMPQPQVNSILQLPPEERYAAILHMEPTEWIALRKTLHGNDEKLGAGLTPLQRETISALSGSNRMLSSEAIGSRLLRDIYSDRQLEAVMTDFWLNHFNVYLHKNDEMPSLLPEYERVVRAHALGRFEDLLVATAKSPAMLLYLDNAQSTGPGSIAALHNRQSAARKPSPGLNENYAREVMELHTLGVNGGYTQTDVTELAKVFTGWTVEKSTDGNTFLFNQKHHEPGAKHLLGQTISESGEAEGEQALHMLATSPATAHLVSLQLAQRFVSDKPPSALVNRMSKAFLQSNGDIRTVLRTMLHSPEFFAPTTVHAKLKTPLEYVTSAARASHAEIENPVPLAQSLTRLGMPFYGYQPPTGYKWDSETWLSSSALLNRMNFALSFSSNHISGTRIDLPQLLAEGTTIPRRYTETRDESPGSKQLLEGKERALETVLLDSPASPQTRTAILAQAEEGAQKNGAFGRPVLEHLRQQENDGRGKMRPVGAAGRPPFSTLASPGASAPPHPPRDRQAEMMFGLLLGSPEFQRR